MSTRHRVARDVSQPATKTSKAAAQNSKLAAMFTGIVEESGVVERVTPTDKSIQLTIRTRVCGAGLKVGDSLAVNGCCLTAVKLAKKGRDKLVQFDLLRETWIRTNFQHIQPGSLVNFERPLHANGRLDGHFVTGHVDGLGQIVKWERAGADHVLDIEPERGLMRYLVYKGSVAVDGISLTVAAVAKKTFRIWIIPHTFEVTNLCSRKVGDWVNLEADILGKYVERFLAGKRDVRS